MQGPLYNHTVDPVIYSIDACGYEYNVLPIVPVQINAFGKIVLLQL